MGAMVSLIGAVGADDNGRAALQSLREDRVDVRGVAVLDDTPTGAAIIVVDHKGENQIALGPGANGAVDAAHVRAALNPALNVDDVVLVNTEIPLDAVAAAIETALTAGAQCILNPAPVIPGLHALLAHGLILTPNEIELGELYRQIDHTDSAAGFEDKLAGLIERTRAAVIVTLGAAGCGLRMPTGEFIRMPAGTVRHVVDTTGAGDTFNGVFASRLTAGEPVTEAIRVALTAASLSVGAAGARSGMPRAEVVTKARAQEN
jgi:ribokinase